jgi:molybdenum cofactor guanylyltransferase
MSPPAVAAGRGGWTGAILCGGRSRRMGRDKALMVVGGEPMVLRVARALHDAGARSVLAVGGDQVSIRVALAPLAPLTPAGAVVTVADDVPGAGPLGGLLTALAATDSPVVLVVACDLLTPSAPAMGATVEALLGRPDADVALPMRDDQAEWLHAAWRRRTVADPLAARFAAGERAVHRAVAAAGLRAVNVPDLDPAALADADVPDDLLPDG